MRLGEIISQYREEHNMSMEAFGEKAGMTKAYVSMLENGNKSRGGYPSPSVRKVRNAASAMNMDINALWELLDDNISLDDDSNKDVVYTVPAKVSSENPSTFRSPEYFYDFVRSMPSEELDELFKRLFERLDKDTLLRLGSLILQIASTK